MLKPRSELIKSLSFFHLYRRKVWHKIPEGNLNIIFFWWWDHDRCFSMIFTHFFALVRNVSVGVQLDWCIAEPSLEGLPRCGSTTPSTGPAWRFSSPSCDHLPRLEIMSCITKKCLIIRKRWSSLVVLFTNELFFAELAKVLTTSTVKFLVADQLPKVPYFTALEWSALCHWYEGIYSFFRFGCTNECQCVRGSVAAPQWRGICCSRSSSSPRSASLRFENSINVTPYRSYWSFAIWGSF